MKEDKKNVTGYIVERDQCVNTYFRVHSRMLTDENLIDLLKTAEGIDHAYTDILSRYSIVVVGGEAFTREEIEDSIHKTMKLWHMDKKLSPV